MGSLANPVGVEHFAKSRASTTEGDLTYDVRPSFRIARHERTSKDKHDKHTVTDTLQQQLRTMMSGIQGRKAFVQCAILVVVVLLALTANAAAQEHRGRHSRRHHDAVHHDAVHLDPRPGDYTLTYTHYPDRPGDYDLTYTHY